MVLFWLGLFFLLQGDMYGSSLHPVVSISIPRRYYAFFGADNVSIRLVLFPECVARVPVSLWGLGVKRVCSLDVAFTVATVRNRPQPFATVRNRPRYPRMAVPLGRGGPFWRFQTCRCFVSRGRRGTS